MLEVPKKIKIAIDTPEIVTASVLIANVCDPFDLIEKFEILSMLLKWGR